MFLPGLFLTCNDDAQQRGDLFSIGAYSGDVDIGS
jgi:hypothetical protein